MHDDGFILSDDDLKKYNGHKQIDKYYFPEGADGPTIDTLPDDTPIDDIKEWLRPTKTSSEDHHGGMVKPALQILMIKTKNEFSGDPEQHIPSHRTIPGKTEVEPHPNQKEHIKLVREVFRHAKLPLAAVGAYIKSHITFLSAPTYEVFGDEGTNGGEVTRYYCSGTSWSIAWSYFHATRHTSAVLLYREGDGALRRGELEHEILRLKQHISHPLLLAFIKTQISLVWTFQLLEQMNGQTFDIEKSVGLATWDWCLDREIQAYQEPNTDDVDFEEKMARAQKQAVERYNVLSNKIINIKFRLRSFREQISWVRRMNNVHLKSLVKSCTNFEVRRRECQELNTILDRLDDFNKVYLHDADTLAERLSQQMATMSHLVTQRDSRISLAIADINNELAWQGKNTNHAMMAIAVANFLFLPATFIASVFDTPIFDFGGQNGNTIVTRPFWIFWLACGSTTALLCLCWSLYIRAKRAFDRQYRQDERKEFRRTFLRTPTLTKRTKRVGPAAENVQPQGAWFSFWSGRVGKLPDEEHGIGLGALKAASCQKTI
ncbi:hypothetical protein LTR05_002757 [Lithohypha guttulata]|uniref:Uncharacterized protein n=1 Tax=Lithohypha guttulata TaxID=1690604 RepID=A0AAN7T2S0_9EURO|nr:hypothetical protein LTR05_002757 [Lithohypha guttulata]